ncbi:MAG: hypothetical protein LBI03_07630 [Clostridiales bacterium]|jgi:phenylacetate-coenzyme A ligase PaaK-like adenylate-forming protein|nr:hypothetical protein [Clostridiales bacterium]
MMLSNRFYYSKSFQEKCEFILNMAFEHVPLYKNWKQFDLGPKLLLDERFDALPALTKSDMRNNFPIGLMPDDKDLNEGLKKDEIEYTFTSGTTAEKVVNIWNQDWWNRSEKASWKLNRYTSELSYPQKQAKLASSLNVGISCEEDLPMDHRILGNTLYLNEKTSILQWQPRHLKRMADELSNYQPAVLEANPSLLARLAWWAIDNEKELFNPNVIIFTFEFPSAIHLAVIKKAFPSSALVSSYGSTETGFVMEQCQNGLMHQNTLFCRIDFEPLKTEFGGPDLGRIFVTTFDNPWNCVIRFDIGDLIRLHPNGKCSCGNSEGMIADAVEGRTTNVTFKTDGGLVTTKMLDDKLCMSPIRDYHIEQNDQTHYLLQVMLSPGANQKSTLDELHESLEKIYGSNGNYEIQVMDSILPGPAGKFRRTQVNFTFDERKLFR